MRNQPAWLVVAALLMPDILTGADWPQFRGPRLDGSTPETIRTNWTQRPLQVAWSRAIGPGWSGAAVVGGLLVTQALETRESGPREVCLALEATTGRPLWSRDVEDAAYDSLVGYDSWLNGPRSTPTLVGDRVIVLTSRLKLYCLDADTGEIAWQRDLIAELGGSVIRWQAAASPLVVGDLVFVNANAPERGLLGIRWADGHTVWRNHDEPMTHASPALGVISGVPQVIFLTQRGLVALVPETGELLWRSDFLPSSTSTAATPVIARDHVYASAAYSAGAWGIHVARAGDGFNASQVWRHRATAFQNHWSTPVEHQGHLYSIVEAGTGGDGRVRSLACLDLTAGVNRWVTTGVGAGHVGRGGLLKAGDHVLVLSESGELVLVQPDPAAYVELARQQMLRDGLCWSAPTLAGGLLFARNSPHLDRNGNVASGQLIAVAVAPESDRLPPLTLSAGSGRSAQTLGVRVSALDGTPLGASHAPRIGLRTSGSLSGPAGGWNPISAGWRVVRGGLEAEIPAVVDTQFLQVQGQ